MPTLKTDEKREEALNRAASLLTVMSSINDLILAMGDGDLMCVSACSPATGDTTHRAVYRLDGKYNSRVKAMLEAEKKKTAQMIRKLGDDYGIEFSDEEKALVSGQLVVGRLTAGVRKTGSAPRKTGSGSGKGKEPPRTAAPEGPPETEPEETPEDGEEDFPGRYRDLI